MDFKDIGKQSPFSDAWMGTGANVDAGFHPEAPGVGLPMTHNQLHDAPFPVVLARARAIFNMSDDTAFAYQTDQSDLLDIPTVREPSPPPAEQLAASKQGAVAHLILDAQSIEAGIFQDVEAMGRTDKRRANRAAKSTPGSIEQSLRSEVNKPWVQCIFDSKREGLHRSNTLGLATMAFYLSYAPEIMDYAPEQVGTVNLDEETAKMLLGEDAQPGSTAINVVSDALRSDGKVDLSKEALDDRVAGFWALATVETAALAIRDLRDFGKLGGRKAAKARQIYEKHKDALFANDVGGPLDLLDEIAETAEIAADGTPPAHRTTKALLGAMSEQSSGTAAHMVQFVNMVRAVYDRLGYPYHPAIAPRNEDGTMIESGFTMDSDVPSAGEEIAAAAEEVPAAVAEGEVATDGLSVAVAAERRERFITHYLDEIILPNYSEGGLEGEEFQDRLRKVAEDIAKESEVDSGGVLIIWERLYDLAHIASYYGGKLYKSKAGELGAKKTEPYFVTFFSLGDNNYGVAESPVYSHGTYIVAEDYANGPCLEVLKMRRKDARANGAVSIPHVKPHYHGFKHQQKIHGMVTAFEDGNLPERHAAMR